MGGGGSVGVGVGGTPLDTHQQQYFEVMYDRKCHSDPLRLNRFSRPIGLSLDPATECQMGEYRVTVRVIG